MTFNDLAPYITPPALAAIAIGIGRFLRALARFMYRRAKASKDTRDDAIAAKWLGRAETLNDVTDFVVHYFVPSAYAPPRETVTTPGIERAEADERGGQ